MIYLDSNSTTQIDPAVLDAMLPFLKQSYGNPSASYAAGRHAHRALEQARNQVASLINAAAEEIIFTSGATESINSVHAFAQAEWPQRPILIIGSTEHSAVLECAERWLKQGGQVKRIPVDHQGVVDLNALRTSLEPGKTALVSIMWANNETGCIAPMKDIVEISHEAGALVHADAVQVMGKMAIDIQNVPVDYLSLSGHKMHAPKGIGALFVSHRVPFRPYLVGGGQENGRRSGTENMPGIVALGKAAEMAHHSLTNEKADDPTVLRDHLETTILKALPDTHIHSHKTARLGNTSSLCFPGVDAAGLLILLDKRGIACSGGSACHAGALHPSHVLEAMGYDARHASSTLRFSFSRFNTDAEVTTAAQEVIKAVQRMREIFDYSSPVAIA